MYDTTYFFLDFQCLVHIELPYEDEIRLINKESVKGLQVDQKEDKFSLIDKYIDTMMLTKLVITLVLDII